MSIIYDALKKVETGFHPDDLAGQKTKKSETAKGWRKIYLVYPVIAILGFLAAAYFNHYMLLSAETLVLDQPKTVQPAPLPPVVANVVTPAPAAPVTPSVPLSAPVIAANAPESVATEPKEVNKESVPQFVLNGVFFSGDEGYALINNQILKEGDTTMEGALVVKITSKNVELDLNGSRIKLSTNTKL